MIRDLHDTNQSLRIRRCSSRRSPPGSPFAAPVSPGRCRPRRPRRWASAARLDLAHKALDAYVDEGRNAGYLAYFARDGKVVDWHAHGWRDVEGRKPFERDTIVRLYSNTKVITAVAVLTLLEQDRLTLGDPIEKYLPELKDRQVLVGGSAGAPQLEPAKSRITVLHLLNQTSGYYYDAD